MRELRKALVIWTVLMGLFLLVIIAVNRYGDQAVRTVESRRNLTRGLELESANKLNEAIRNYEEVVSADERALRPRALLVRAYMKAGRSAEALSQAERAVDIAPSSQQSQPLLLLSRVCREMGMWDRAQSTSQQAIEASPKCAEAYYEAAKVAEAMRMYKRMVEALDKVARVGTRASSAEYEEARSRRRERIAQHKAKLKERGASSQTYYQLGVLYKEMGLWQDAVEAFAEAASSGRSRADANFWLGVQAEVQGDLGGAIRQYRRVVETCPNHVNGLLNLERCLLLKKVAEQPAEARAWYRLGLLSLRFRNWQEASSNFSRALEIDPAFADAHFRLGSALEMLGKPTDARAAYAETIRFLPTHLQALQALHRFEAER